VSTVVGHQMASENWNLNRAQAEMREKKTWQRLKDALTLKSGGGKKKKGGWVSFWRRLRRFQGSGGMVWGGGEST